ncbi:hypothetical protein GN958_ATG13189, partial [Phytophthora infestans]
QFGVVDPALSTSRSSSLLTPHHWKCSKYVIQTRTLKTGFKFCYGPLGDVRFHWPSYNEVIASLSEAAKNWLGSDFRSSFPLHAFEQYMVKVVETFVNRRNESRRSKTVVARSKSGISDNEEHGEGSPNVEDSCLPQGKLDAKLVRLKTFDITFCLDADDQAKPILWSVNAIADSRETRHFRVYMH